VIPTLVLEVLVEQEELVLELLLDMAMVDLVKIHQALLELLKKRWMLSTD
jgi:hypothetical protein